MLKRTIKIVFFCLVLLCINCKNSTKDIAQNLPSSSKSFEVKGFNIVCKDQLTLKVLQELKATGTTYIAINMVSDIYIGSHIEPYFDDAQHEPFQNLNDYSSFINKAHLMEFQVMLKPLVKVSNLLPASAFNITKEILEIKDTTELNKRLFEYLNNSDFKVNQDKNKMWHGNFDFEDQSHWANWETIYENHILKIASYANEMGISMFGVGNEIDEVAVTRANYMQSLIKKVRAVFKGKLIYASNWDRYEDITFWDDVDYISMSGYFPLGNEETPSVDIVKNNWKNI